MMSVTDHPHLQVHAPGSTEAVVLVLHGGREVGTTPVRPQQLAVLRMLPFARAVRRHAGDRVAVARLRYRVRGWNAAAGRTPDPVRDAEWALAELAERFPGRPIGLIGHSMGGRTALWVAGHPAVSTIAALAPWIEGGDPVEQLAGRRILFMHGTADRMTSPRRTTALAERLAEDGADAGLVLVDGEKHAMLGRPRLWHQLASQFVLAGLLTGFEPSDWPGAPNDWRLVVQARARITY